MIEPNENTIYSSRRDEPMPEETARTLSSPDPIAYTIKQPVIIDPVKEITPVEPLSEEATAKEVPAELIQEVAKPVKRSSLLSKLVLTIYQLIY
jgi:hypothetical protein